MEKKERKKIKKVLLSKISDITKLDLEGQIKEYTNQNLNLTPKEKYSLSTQTENIFLEYSSRNYDLQKMNDIQNDSSFFDDENKNIEFLFDTIRNSEEIKNMARKCDKNPKSFNYFLKKNLYKNWNDNRIKSTRNSLFEQSNSKIKNKYSNSFCKELPNPAKSLNRSKFNNNRKNNDYRNTNLKENSNYDNEYKNEEIFRTLTIRRNSSIISKNQKLNKRLKTSSLVIQKCNSVGLYIPNTKNKNQKFRLVKNPKILFPNQFSNKKNNSFMLSGNLKISRPFILLKK